MMDRIHFSWNLLFKCNYRCPYCWFNDNWIELEKTTQYLCITDLMRSWKNIHRRYGSVIIDILGGEPFLYPNFIELIKELCNFHTINITTNLSCNVDKFVRNIDASKVGIRATFHPLFAEFDSFIKKTLLLKENNFGDKVTYLAYPPQIKLINYYREKFNKAGLYLTVMTFWGKYNGIDYPTGYTDEEKRLIEPYLDDRNNEKFQITPKKIRGMLCRAGQTYAVILSDGTTIRCGGAKFSDSDYTIGNFFKEDFQLSDKPFLCSSEYCPCNEWAFLLVKEDEITTKKLISRKSIPPYRVFFSWYLNNECNYKCSYCKPQDINTVFVSVDKWIEIWDEIYDKYESCHIHISGGEPFIYPHFIELITQLSRKHTLEFSTNLSCNIRPFIDNISPERARLGASFHPEYADFHSFFKKVLLLKEKGYEVWVNYVAYPPHLKDMVKYKRLVDEIGVHFSILPFNGEFAGRQYPQNYTGDEKKIMTFGEIGDVNRETIDWRTDQNKSSIKGKLCKMGQMYARIYPDGGVSRCCGNGALRLGNLVDKTFKLLEEPLPCECDNCPCWKCMLVGQESYWEAHWITPRCINM